VVVFFETPVKTSAKTRDKTSAANTASETRAKTPPKTIVKTLPPSRAATRAKNDDVKIISTAKTRAKKGKGAPSKATVKTLPPSRGPVTRVQEKPGEKKAPHAEMPANIAGAAKTPSRHLTKTRVLKKAPPDLKIILEGVQATTLELFNKLNAFNKNKQGFRAIVEFLDPDGLLRGIEVEVVGLFADQQIKLVFYQCQADGTPIRSIDDLYQVAEAVLPMFQMFLQDIAGKAGVKAKPAPLKGKVRAKQKGDSEYAGRECPDGGPVIGWVFDIVRGTLLCDSAEQIEAVVKLFVADKRVKVIITFKNRFKNPTPNGFCDMLLHFVFSDGGIKHVCEVQVHLRQITEYAAEHKSHESYDYFRLFFDGSMNTVASRLEDMAEIVGEDFAPAEDGTPPADVMEDIVSDVVESKDRGRLLAMAELCRKYIAELDLAVFTHNKKAEVEIAEYGLESEEVSDTFNILAFVLTSQGKLEEAMEMYEKCLAIQLKILGPEHKSLANIYSAMGDIQIRQGKLKNGIEMLDTTIAARLNVLGSEEISEAYSNAGVATEVLEKAQENVQDMYKLVCNFGPRAYSILHQDKIWCVQLFFEIFL
jgi:hypothetical protein